MGIISESYIKRLLAEYVKTPEGQAAIADWRKEAFSAGYESVGGMTRSELQGFAEELRQGFAAAVMSVIKSFREDQVFVEIGEMNSAGQVPASITVNESALRRESLHYMTSEGIRHGDGVDDILALFTHGYTINKRPYGFWVRDTQTMGGDVPLVRIGALMHRDPNPFLINFVNEMNARYGGICTLTLNNDYKA